MIRRDGDRMMVSGPLTLAHVAAALSEGNLAIGEGVSSIDLAEVGELGEDEGVVRGGRVENGGRRVDGEAGGLARPALRL